MGSAGFNQGRQLGGNVSFAQSLSGSQPATPLDPTYVLFTSSVFARCPNTSRPKRRALAVHFRDAPQESQARQQSRQHGIPRELGRPIQGSGLLRRAQGVSRIILSSHTAPRRRLHQRLFLRMIGRVPANG